ncbi:uncharacterized protein LOC122084328 isoform X2 [Macadamia integrifolia]|uniref:uncharacterized protein LOC122084328 isoform X2 n=1 Tax=Macadamia integrifolia TaxID=60698 RepID=UPI001C4F558C|nr:uncharacterized protein LOC122084328 isoform X2 [Macadamia integrifolia]
MSLQLNHASLHPQSPCLHLHGILQIQASRFSTRRKLKLDRTFALRYHVRSSLSASFENLFQNLICQFPSVNSLDLIAPALGLASGAALYLSHFKSPRNSGLSDIGEWILFTTPTPFNRFVLLRCPSMQFEGSELLQEVNDKLVKEDRHFVKLNGGRIHVPYPDEMQMHGRFEEKLVYQRVCVSTDDGGVISLDWPANLDLTEELGLDTTLLLVPGTTEGSTDKNVRSFVCESLKQGCFPVVMNPRGCAGSPLTTPRLFTAADSDDVCTAIKFINGARPWTTLMGVGWGYGANMLTKYLAEVGERTPLTAAACIDSPFDLEEATRSSPYHLTIDQKLKGGLIDILSSNKELFQGRAKGFNVEKALSATSVRDFEKAISMISYGFEDIEEFYATSSTRQLVGNVKIPVLFIQSDDGMVPIFSIPRSSVAENPFTSLLLCSCLPSTTRSDISAISWCQHLAIEWLTAVELGLLKGRHPLLKDVDVTINPSKGLALLESKASDKSRNKNNHLNPTPSDVLSGYSVGPLKDAIDETNTAPHLRSGRDLERKSKFQDEGQEQLVNVFVSQQNSLIHAESLKEEGDDPVDSERGEVLQTAEMVINMLDVNLPGTLAEEQKKKVLAAVEQGETVMKALQGAVPEDVRGKLTAAVSEIVQTQGTNLNLDRLMMIGRTSSLSKAKSKAHEKAGGPLSSENGSSSSNSSDLVKTVDELTTASDNNQSGMEKPSGGIELELQPPSKSLKSIEIGQSQCVSAPVDISNSGKKDTNEAEQNQGKDELLKERSVRLSEYEETSSETGGNHNHHSRYEKTSSTEEAQGKVTQGNGIAHMGVKEVNDNRTTEDESSDASVDQSKQIPSAKSEEALPFVTASPQPEPMENVGNNNQTNEEKNNNNQTNEEKNVQPMTDQNKQGCTKSEETSPFFVQAPNPPSLNVSQALDALTGLDDSTQMAVNSVFGVIEDMIIQLEGKDNRNDGKEDKIEDRVEDENEKPGSASEPSVTSEHKLEIEEDSEKGMSSEANQLQSCDNPVDNSCEKCAEPPQDTRNGWDERKLTDNPSSLYKSSTGGFWGYFNGNNLYKEDKKRKVDLTRSKFLVENLDKSKPVHKFPLYVTINPYRDSQYSEYLNKYLLSKMSNTTSLDLDTTTDLLLDYIPEEGQWKLLDQPGNSRNLGVDRKGQDICSTPDVYDVNKIIEPSYVILDTEKEMQQIEEYGTVEDFNQKAQIGSDVSSEELTQFIKSIILDSLKFEVDRKLGASTVKAMESDLTQDLEQVANAVSLAIGRSEELIWSLASKDPASRKFGTLNGELIINTISSAIQDANYLGKVLPIGVIIGSSLAALRKHFSVATIDPADSMGEEYYGQVGQMGSRHKPVEKKDQFSDMDGLSSRVEGKVQGVNLKNDTMMVGAVTAALGASALMVHQQRAPERSVEITEVSSTSLNVRGGHEMEPDKLQEEISEKNQNNIVTCLAEKAMAVAGPVVPTKNDGEVDQERLVAMLADLGQKGGMLRLVGKIALLWGGIRGAMSLTDRLISFLRLAERPLVQRILGFVFMVLVLWSPVVVPLLPTLVQGWATHNSNGIAKYACIGGLHTAVLILIMLWGKRIRGYENPLEQYGLDLTSLQKLHDCLKGLTAGVMLVLSIHSVNALLGWACFSWPSRVPSSLSDAVACLKVCGEIFVLTGQGIMAAIGIAIAEELLFRSWLPEEIAVDLGYHQAIIISGLTFSILQRFVAIVFGSLWDSAKKQWQSFHSNWDACRHHSYQFHPTEGRLLSLQGQWSSLVNWVSSIPTIQWSCWSGHILVISYSSVSTKASTEEENYEGHLRREVR